MALTWSPFRLLSSRTFSHLSLGQTWMQWMRKIWRTTKSISRETANRSSPTVFCMCDTWDKKNQSTPSNGGQKKIMNRKKEKRSRTIISQTNRKRSSPRTACDDVSSFNSTWLTVQDARDVPFTFSNDYLRTVCHQRFCWSQTNSDVGTKSPLFLGFAPNLFDTQQVHGDEIGLIQHKIGLDGND